MADETFSRDRSFVIIISRSANWFIRFNRGGEGKGYETTAGFTVERPYRLFIAADPEIPIDIGIENGTKASFWWLARYNQPTRIGGGD